MEGYIRLLLTLCLKFVVQVYSQSTCSGNGLLQRDNGYCIEVYCEDGLQVERTALSQSCCINRFSLNDFESEITQQCLQMYAESCTEDYVFECNYRICSNGYLEDVLYPLISQDCCRQDMPSYDFDECFTQFPDEDECTENDVQGCSYRQCSGGHLGDLIRAVISQACCHPDYIETSAYGYETCYTQFPDLYTSTTTAPASFSDVKPVISVNLQHEDSTSKLLFKCVFPMSTETFYYTTVWYVNGNTVHTFQPMLWTDDTFDYIAMTTLTEDMLKAKGVTKAGFNLQCSVGVQYSLEGMTSQSQASDENFVGAKLGTWNNYVLNEGESRPLYVYLTVPFGCGTQHQGQACLFNIEIETLGAPSVVIENSCSVEPFSADKWANGSHLTVVAKTTSDYGEASVTSQLKVKTPQTNSAMSSLWHDYGIGSVEITVVKNTTEIKYRSCMSTNDPYIWTFGRTSYNLMIPGVFTMYKDNDRNVEVQIQTEFCSNQGYCTCGVAVRAGKTVFEISHCDSNTWTIGYTACDDDKDILDVRGTNNNYMIVLPTGNSIYVYLSTWRRNFVNVYVYPTVQDVGKSRGICGILSSTSGNDLIMKNGVATTSTSTFSQSWRVSMDESLFNPDYIRTSLSSYKTVNRYCTCAGSGSDRSTTCSPRAASDTHNIPSYYQKKIPKDCTISKRKKRMALNTRERVKRNAPSWVNGWNATAANDFCESRFSESNIVSKLTDVPGVDVARMKSECVEDIKLSGTTDFSDMAVASVRVTALREAMVNPDLSEKDPANPSAPTMKDIVTLQTCSGDCGGKGTCSKGLCQCDAGFGGEDCSVDLTIPPVVYDVGDEGHCDLAAKNCVFVSVIGDIFSGSADSKCRIEKNMVQSTGETNMGVVKATLAVSESISEVICTLPEPAANDVVNTYAISVSQSGNSFSNHLNVLVYDSSCVTVNHTTKVWTVEDGYCVHKGRCTALGASRGDNPCLKCDSKDGSLIWKQSTEGDCPNGFLTFSDDKSGSDVPVQSVTMSVISLWLMAEAFLS